MPIMDVFDQDAFSFVSLSAAVDKVGYAPGFLTARPGLLTPVPVRTDEVWIEERAFMPQLIQTTPRGAPPIQVSGDKRDARPFQTVRIALSSRINASELKGIRDFGSEQAMKTVMSEVSRRQFKMKQDEAITKENMLLGCVQGIVLDADGSVISNWGANTGQTIPAEVSWNSALTATSGAPIEELCNAVRRAILRALRGLGGTNVRIEAICGDTFWDLMMTSVEVRSNYQALAAQQRINDLSSAFSSYRYGNITFHNYRGTDDNEVQVGSTKCKFFPVGAGTILRVDAPGERFTDLETMGQESYEYIVPDLHRDSYADLEHYSYPLFVNTMPSAGQSARSTA